MAHDGCGVVLKGGDLLNRLKKYQALMKSHPHLFLNPNEKGAIKIIVDPEEIRKQQLIIREKYVSEGKPQEWIDIGVLVDDPWFLVIRDMVEFPNEKKGGYIRFVNRKVLEGGIGSVIVPLLNKRLVLLKHFRHDDRSWHWEFPRGFGVSGIDARTNAIKELEEEIGVSSFEIAEIGLQTGGTRFFLAQIPSTETITIDHSEGIAAFELIDKEGFINWVFEGKIDDAFTLKAFLLALHHQYI